MASGSTVFVVDDDLGTRRSLGWLIQQANLPVKVFGSGREFLDGCDADQAGCLVLDLRMPELDGLEVQKRLVARGISLPIIFLTAHGNVPTCSQAFKAGAFEFLEKPVDGEVLLTHVQKALSRDAQQRQDPATSKFSARVSLLTRSEREVFNLLIAGKSLKEIAIARTVTVQTAWKQRVAVLRKMPRRERHRTGRPRSPVVVRTRR